MSMLTILYPLPAMVLLITIVAVVMFRRRVAAMKAERIHPQKVALSGPMATMIADTRASDNFRNLFEMPVLFYAALIMLFVCGWNGPAYLALAWLYVALRYAHSLIHCGSNRIMPRFYVFLASFVVLLALWGMITFDLLAHA